MSVADQLIEEGVEKGIERGIEQVARNMIAAGKSDEEIAELTGLSVFDVQKLR